MIMHFGRDFRGFLYSVRVSRPEKHSDEFIIDFLTMCIYI